MDFDITIRTAKETDAEELLNIYGYYVENTAITYEYDIPTVEDFKNRILNTLKKYPYLVAEKNGKILGYAYAGPFHPRVAYGWNAEMTVYLDHNLHGHGVGKKLYTLLEDILKEQGIIKAIAIITPPGNEQEKSTYPSVGFHEKMGYTQYGYLKNSGYKFGRWFDTVYMDKQLAEPKENMEQVKKYNQVRQKFGL